MTTAGTLTTLIDFLLARIAEDEADAQEVFDFDKKAEQMAAQGWRDARPTGPASATAVIAALGVAGARHVHRWSPARVLAECDAKRRIVDEHAGNGDMCVRCGDGHDDYGDLWLPFPCPTLRFLAIPYADHPDYRDEWRA